MKLRQYIALPKPDTKGLISYFYVYGGLIYMPRLFGRDKEKIEQQNQTTNEQPKVKTEETENQPTVEVREVEITLSLLNQKLNYQTALLAEILDRLELKSDK